MNRIKTRASRCLTFTLVFLGVLASDVLGQPYTFTHLAGGVGGGAGFEDGTGSAARFSSPMGVAVDSAGTVYVADRYNHTIRKITSGGVVTTLAGLAGAPGSADGTGGAARFNNPEGVVVDSAGAVYVADTYNHTIRKITSGGIVTTLAGLAGFPGSADGTGSGARFYYPTGVAVDSGGTVYVTDYGNHTIRQIASGGVVTTLAGLAGSPGNADGTGSGAQFNKPMGVAVDSAGTVYVADYGNHTIRQIASGGVVTTLAGLAGAQGSADGTGSGAQFCYPMGVSVDGAGSVYVADTANHTIRQITSGGVVTTFAGLAYSQGLAGSQGNADGTGSGAQFSYPYGVAADSGGTVYVADHENDTIRKITSGGVVTTLAGLAGSPGSSDGTGSAARFYGPYGVAVDSSGMVYVAERYNHTIRKITSGGVVTTLAGLAGDAGIADGTGTAAQFFSPSGVAVDSVGTVYVADTFGQTIRKITRGGVVTTLAGLPGVEGTADGTGSGARFYYPESVAVDSAGTIYVADTSNFTIRKITSGGVVTTLAGLAGSQGSADGTGSVARFYWPCGVAVDSSGMVYVADTYNHTIRKITSGGGVTTLAGIAGTAGARDGAGSAARFAYPNGVAADGVGNVYVADTANHAIRIGTPTIADEATIDAASGPLGVARQLDSSPQTATSWQWSIIRRPAGSVAQLSSTSIRNPSFIPDVADLFVFRLVASSTGGSSITTVSLGAVAAPTITNINPNRGPAVGGQSVVITGTNLSGATVTIGGSAATVTGTTVTTATFTTPAHGAGAVNVTVTTAGGSATSTSGYTYVAAPTITTINPNRGPLGGAQSVVITGTNLSAATVTIGGSAATVTGTTATTVSLTTPAHAAGVVNVVATTSGGSATSTGGYTYVAAPTITTINPNRGPLGGAQSVVITGTNLSGATVTIGGSAATVTGTTATTVSLTTPAHAAGVVNVVATTSGGSATSTGGYTYVAAPTITTINPNRGPLGGAQSVVVTGTNLSGATVTIGGSAATVTGTTATTVSLTTPAHAAGVVNVVATTSGGSATSTGGYTYVAAPTITTINPNRGPLGGAQSVVITGTNLSGATVTIGGSAATVTGTTATTATFTTPAHAAGAVNVTVTTIGGSATLTGGYTYVAAPTITTINPNRGPLGGAQSVVITGTNLSGATVTFGGIAAAVTGTTATTVTFATPAHAAAAVNVTVTTAGGSATATGGYTYVAPPTIASINPNRGPTAGGQSVTITGTNLSGATVTFGGIAAAVTGTTATTVTFATPAHAAAAVNVTVTTAGGSATAAGGYTYCSPSMSPTTATLVSKPGTYSVNVTAGPCVWKPHSNAFWATVENDNVNRTGNGSFVYTTTESFAERRGSVDVSGTGFSTMTLSLTQQAPTADPGGGSAGGMATRNLINAYFAGTTQTSLRDDMNGDCVVNTTDVFHLINAVFANGQPLETCPLAK